MYTGKVQFICTISCFVTILLPTYLGNPLERHQDRLFITASAVNALYNIWTVKGKFIDNTPEKVKAAIKLGAEWIYKNALTNVYQPYNAVGGFLGLVVCELFHKWQYVNYV